MNAKVGARAHQAIRVRRTETIFRDQPVHQVERRRLDRDLEGTRGVDGNQRLRLLDAHPRDLLRLDDIELDAYRRLGLGGGAGELGVALAGMDVAEAKEGAGMMDRQIDAVADGDVADVEVAPPFA